MRLPELRVELARYARKMYDSQLVRATQGNLSARDPESGLICITPSGADYLSLSAEDIAVIDEQNRIVESKWQPSVEAPLHTRILRGRRDIHCVMHTHSIYASVCGVLYQPVPMVLAESAACLGGTVPIVPYLRSGTVEFGESVASILGDGMAVIWGNHGAMSVGVNLAQAFGVAHALEDTARVYLLAKQAGTPVILPTDEIEALHHDWRHHYRQKAREETSN